MASVHYAPQALGGIPDGAGLIRRPALALQRAAERLVYARKPTGKLLELAGDTPFVSASGTDFCLLRQEMLAYIVMLGYDGTPLLSQLANGQQLTLSKVAMVVLIFLFIRADEEGYICKEAKGKSGYAELLQLKDIAFACHISLPMVSKALKHWLLAGVIKRVTCAGIRGYRFSNQMPMLHI